jgi:hypothetical protein
MSCAHAFGAINTFGDAIEFLGFYENKDLYKELRSALRAQGKQNGKNVPTLLRFIAFVADVTHFKYGIVRTLCVQWRLPQL